MAMTQKRHLTPLSKKGAVTKTPNKGMAGPSKNPFQSINDYAKDTPMANPQPALPGVPQPMPPYGE